MLLATPGRPFSFSIGAMAARSDRGRVCDLQQNIAMAGVAQPAPACQVFAAQGRHRLQQFLPPVGEPRAVRKPAAPPNSHAIPPATSCRSTIGRTYRGRPQAWRIRTETDSPIRICGQSVPREGHWPLRLLFEDQILRPGTAGGAGAECVTASHPDGAGMAGSAPFRQDQLRCASICAIALLVCRPMQAR